MLVDANLLLYAVDTSAVEHGVASRWLEEQLNGNRRVGLPWSRLAPSCALPRIRGRLGTR